jgi:membrane-bound ClpP family serine protease
MPILIVFLFVVGVFAIMMETIAPFGIAAAIGLLIIGASGWLAVAEFGPALGLLYCIFALVVAVVTARFSVRGGLIVMTLRPPRSTAGDESDKPPDEAELHGPAVGQTVVVVQPLRPTGSILWEGRRLPARTSQAEIAIPSGARAVVRAKESI